MVTAAGFCFQIKGQTKKEPIMPQPETAGSDSPDVDREDEDTPSVATDPVPEEGADAGGEVEPAEPSEPEPSPEPVPGPVVRITITPGRETDEDVEPGEEVPNVEVDVTTEPR